jgi:uncharacterized protein
MKIRKGFSAMAISIGFLLFTFTSAMGAKEIHLGTSPVGGLGYSAGVVIAQVINKYCPEFHVTAEIAGGSLENLRMMGEKKMEMAVTSPYLTSLAMNGQAPFKDKVGLRTIFRAVPLTNEFIVLESSGIKTHEELKGKRVNIGHPGGADIHGLAILDSYGIKRGDVKASVLGIGAAVDALKDGKFDAVTATPQLMNQAMATHKIRVLWPDEAHIEIIMKRNPTFGKWLMPAEFVKGVEKPIWVPDFGFQLTCLESMDEKDVYKITKALVDHLDELVATFSQFIADKEWVSSSLGIPYHPGAVKYFKEQGLMK